MAPTLNPNMSAEQLMQPSDLEKEKQRMYQEQNKIYGKPKQRSNYTPPKKKRKR